MISRLQPYPVLPSADEVQAFEAEIGFDLPDDYRAFLLAFNGGTVPRLDPDDDDWHLGFQAEAVPPFPPHLAYLAPGSFWDVALFHGLLRPPTAYGDLRDIHAVMRDEWRHPAELLPVASSGGNAKFFLCLAGDRRGQILIAGEAYVDRYGKGEPITPDDYHRLADSFGSLLDRLEWRPIPD